MKQLIEDYERRLKTAETMLKWKGYSSIAQAEVIKTKASCYRTFLSELKQQCNIANIVGQSEQLPEFLMKDSDGKIVTAYHGGSDVTEEWNEYLSNCT